MEPHGADWKRYKQKFKSRGWHEKPTGTEKEKKAK